MDFLVKANSKSLLCLQFVAQASLVKGVETYPHSSLTALEPALIGVGGERRWSYLLRESLLRLRPAILSRFRSLSAAIKEKNEPSVSTSATYLSWKQARWKMFGQFEEEQLTLTVLCKIQDVEH